MVGSTPDHAWKWSIWDGMCFCVLVLLISLWLLYYGTIYIIVIWYYDVLCKIVFWIIIDIILILIVVVL
jgi:hypothetical protein